MSDLQQMTIVGKLETWGHESLSAIEHAAVWLVGTVASSEKSLADLESSSPLVSEAVAAGIASAEVHGVPVGEMDDAGAAVLAAAHEFAAGLAQPVPVKLAPAAPPAVAAADDPSSSPGGLPIASAPGA